MNQSQTIPGVIQGGSSDGTTFFWGVFNGMLSRKVEEGTPNAVSRVNKKGKTVHEIHEKYGLRGILSNVFMKDTEWGRQMVVEMIPAAGFKHVIEMPKDSRYFGNFLEKLPNINLDEPVDFAPYNFENEKGKFSGVSIKQSETKLESFYKEKDANGKWNMKYGFPDVKKPWDKMTDSDKTRYWLDVDDFYEAMLERFRQAYFANASQAAAPAQSEAPASETAQQPSNTTTGNASKPGQNAPSDDLPF